MRSATSSPSSSGAGRGRRRHFDELFERGEFAPARRVAARAHPAVRTQVRAARSPVAGRSAPGMDPEPYLGYLQRELQSSSASPSPDPKAPFLRYDPRGELAVHRLARVGRCGFRGPPNGRDFRCASARMRGGRRQRAKRKTTLRVVETDADDFAASVERDPRQPADDRRDRPALDQRTTKYRRVDPRIRRRADKTSSMFFVSW